MLFLKSWSSENGSAAAEFVMVVIPTTVLLLPLFGLFGLMQARVVNGQLAYEIARYAALADVTSFDTNQYLGNISDKATLSYVTTNEYCQARVKIGSEVSIFAYPKVINLIATGQASCEIQ